MIFALIVAGGDGTRFGIIERKQFLQLQNKPVIYHSIKCFYDFNIRNFTIVLPANFEKDALHTLLKEDFSDASFYYVQGGTSRQESVKNGLEQMVSLNVEKVFIHDAVRPLISVDLLERLSRSKLPAIPVVSLNNSLVKVDKTEVANYLDRSHYAMVQTPQLFHYEAILHAHRFAASLNEEFTDDGAVFVKSSCFSLQIVPGSEENLKITYPIDFELANLLLMKRTSH